MEDFHANEKFKNVSPCPAELVDKIGATHRCNLERNHDATGHECECGRKWENPE